MFTNIPFSIKRKFGSPQYPQRDILNEPKFLALSKSSLKALLPVLPGSSFDQSAGGAFHYYDSFLKTWLTKGYSVMKHCKRHNGPEGKVHITSSYTNLEQISISESKLNLKSWPNLASESWPRFNFVSSTKHHAFHWLNSSFRDGGSTALDSNYFTLLKQ